MIEESYLLKEEEKKEDMTVVRKRIQIRFYRRPARITAYSNPSSGLREDSYIKIKLTIYSGDKELDEDSYIDISALSESPAIIGTKRIKSGKYKDLIYLSLDKEILSLLLISPKVWIYITGVSTFRIKLIGSSKDIDAEVIESPTWYDLYREKYI